MESDGAHRATLVIVAMVAISGAWLIFAPYFGAAESEPSSKMRTIVAHGGRARCLPSVLIENSNLLEDALEKKACNEVGVVRRHFGYMLLLTSGVGALVSRILFQAWVPSSSVPEVRGPSEAG